MSTTERLDPELNAFSCNFPPKGGCLDEKHRNTQEAYFAVGKERKQASGLLFPHGHCRAIWQQVVTKMR
jgi:hypothetical protein